jgi:hypothetical protein
LKSEKDEIKEFAENDFGDNKTNSSQFIVSILSKIGQNITNDIEQKDKKSEPTLDKI